MRVSKMMTDIFFHFWVNYSFNPCMWPKFQHNTWWNSFNETHASCSGPLQPLNLIWISYVLEMFQYFTIVGSSRRTIQWQWESRRSFCLCFTSERISEDSFHLWRFQLSSTRTASETHKTHTGLCIHQPSFMAFTYLGALFSETRNTYQ